MLDAVFDEELTCLLPRRLCFQRALLVCHGQLRGLPLVQHQVRDMLVLYVLLSKYVTGDGVEQRLDVCTPRRLEDALNRLALIFQVADNQVGAVAVR